MGGSFRFLQRVWELWQVYSDPNANDPISKGLEGYDDEPIWRAAHKAVKRVTEDLHGLGFNTAIAALMEYVNTLYKLRVTHWIHADAGDDAWDFALKSLVQLLAPFAPHITEEIWYQSSGFQSVDDDPSDVPLSVHISKWPVHEEKYLTSDTMTIVVQVNGKVRANIETDTSAPEEEIVKAARADENVQKFTNGHIEKKVIYVPGKLVNIVV